MKLTVLGCSGSFPTTRSPASSYLLEQDGHRIVLDLGNGSIGNLQRHVDLDAPDSLAAVVLSHGHLDHCADLGSLFVIRRYHPTEVFRPLRVLGPPGIAQRIADMYGTSVSALSTHLAFEEFTAKASQIGPFTIRTCTARHPVPSASIRVDAAGSSMAYSGDTGPNDALVQLAQGVDLALLEASYVGQECPPDLHLTATAAGDHAARSAAGRLVVTHLVRWNDDDQVLQEASAAFTTSAGNGPTTLAYPGMVIDL